MIRTIVLATAILVNQPIYAQPTVASATPNPVAVSSYTLVTKSPAASAPVTILVNAPSTTTANYDTAQVTLTDPAGPSSADREFQIVLHVKHPRSNSIAYHASATLPEGRSATTLSIPFLQPASEYAWSVDVYENGREITVRNRNTFHLNMQQVPSSGHPIACLILDEALSSGEQENVLLGSFKNMTFHQHTANSSPTDWRQYLKYKAVAVPVELFEELDAKAPDVRRAILNYTAAGGKLVVYGLADMADTATMSKLIDDSPGLTASWGAQDQNKTNSLHERQYLGGQIIWLGEMTSGVSRVLEHSVSSESPLEKTSENHDSDWYWKNLIQAVGKTPVWIFCTIVVLFCFLVGPGLLMTTQRLRRRTLLLFFVPVFSFLVTAAILFYNVLREGFATYARVTSIQFVDLDSGRGFAWSRQTYFSGSPPRHGLAFDSDTYVRPVRTQDGPRNYNRNPYASEAASVAIDEDQNWRDWLTPRQQQQLLIGHPIDALKSPVDVVRHDDGSVWLENRTQATIPLAVIRGEAPERFFIATDIKPGDPRQLTEGNTTDAEKTIRDQLKRFQPTAPPELAAGGSLLSSNWRTGASVSTGSGSDIIEIALVNLRAPQIPFGCLILETESDAIQIPLSARSDKNFHVLQGVLRW